MSNTTLIAKTQKKLNQTLLYYYLGAILVALILGYFIRYSFVESYRIPTEIMRPSLEAGDFIFVSKSQFGIRLPGFSKPVTPSRLPVRGEVVVHSSMESVPRHLIRRVIGLPGDTVSIRQGKIQLNGKELPIEMGPDRICGVETHPAKTYPVCLSPPPVDREKDFEVPQNQLFVIGDNRNQDLHGEDWGLIPIESLEGKPLFIWLSVVPQSHAAAASFASKIRTERIFRKID